MSENKNKTVQNVLPVIEEAAHKLGLIPVELNFVKESGRWVLKIFIYSQDHPIYNLDCENLTRELGDSLDELISEPFNLEVSSPGIDRKLKSSSEYNIFKDKEVEVKLKKPLNETKKLSATIVDYKTNTGLKLKLKDKDETVEVKEDNISSVRLIPDFKR